MVGGRTKVRSVPKQHRRVEALARALLKTKVDSSKRRRMHPCCRSRRNGRCGAEVFTLHLNSVVAAITFSAFSSHPRRGQRERYRCHTSSPLFVVATRQRIVARVWANSRAPRKYYLLYQHATITTNHRPDFFFIVFWRAANRSWRTRMPSNCWSTASSCSPRSRCFLRSASGPSSQPEY